MSALVNEVNGLDHECVGLWERTVGLGWTWYEGDIVSYVGRGTG
jgi:hypothetical protein